MSRRFKPLSIIILSSALATSASSTNPQTGQTEYSKSALYGVGAALACGAIGATRSGKDALNSALACGAVGAAVGGYQDYQEKQLRTKLANTQVGIQRLGDQIKLTLPDNVTFDSDRYQIKNGAQSALASIADSMVQYPNSTITVQGFTDSSGSANHNQELSEHRAEAVTDFLAAHGVSNTRIRTMGLGERQPVGDNRSEAGRALNRRVEILINQLTQ
jgi:outer membrane protein OmpA-like peptidoglycan-associated protein